MSSAAGCAGMHLPRPAATTTSAKMNPVIPTTDTSARGRTESMPTTDTADGTPPALVALRDRWGRAGTPVQKSIVWPQARWTARFPDRADLFDALPNPIGRPDVTTACRHAADSDDDAVAAFIVSMVWGYGSVGYGPWSTRQVLDKNPAAAASLRHSARVQATSGPVDAYRHLANAGRLRYLGPAFATKFLHFVPQCARGPAALIHDALVSNAIRTLTGQPCSAQRWSTPTYARYLDLVGGWAHSMGIEPVDAEMLLFVSQAPRQWREAWVTEPLPQPATDTDTAGDDSVG